ncbi:MAG: VWA domain-containing protein [Myxococcota bacterium]
MTRLLFNHPDWLLACTLGLTVVALALGASSLSARRRLRTLLGRGSRIPRSSGFVDLLMFPALVLIVLATLGPRISHRSVWMTSSGADVVILLDVSRSMDAQDVRPSRLEGAKRAAVRILERLSARSRVALAAFSGRGVLLTPLTPDTNALIEMVSALDTKLIRPGGSELRRGIEASLEAFDEASQRPRVLLVLSDGELSQPLGDIGEVAAIRHNARIVTVAWGDAAGATIPDHGLALRDDRGEIVVTRCHTKPLERLTAASGGLSFHADEQGAFDLERAIDEIDRDVHRTPGEFVERSFLVASVWPFAALAFALLWLEGLPRPRFRWPGRAQRRWVAPTACAAALVVLAQPDPSAGEETRQEHAPSQAVALFEQGRIHAEAGRRKEAQQAFLAAALVARDPRLAALSYHNLGVTLLEQRDFQSARDAFFDALALAPSDDQTRFNLEWTLEAVASRPPELEPPPDPDPGQSRPRDEEAEAKEKPEKKRPDQRPRPAKSDVRPPARFDAEQRRRWLERIEDDPARALRSAVAGRPTVSRRGAPTW